MSLRRQFILVLVTFSLALTGLGGWAALRYTSRALEAEMEDRLEWVAGAAAEVGLQASIVLNFQPGDEASPVWRSYQARLRRLQRYVSDAYIFRRDNTALVTTVSPDSVRVGMPLRWLDAYTGTLDEAWSTGEASTPVFQGVDGQWYKYGFVRLEQSDAMLGVQMLADFLEPLDRFRRNVILGSLIAAVLAAGLAAYLATSITGPLDRLSRVAIRIQRGRWQEPVTVERGDELGRLSRAMERMRKGILQRDEQLRLMLAQVAHEIRNPLEGVELFASAAEDEESPAERKKLLGRVRAEVAALNQIIREFLTFARPDDPDRRIHDVRIPLEAAAWLVRAEMESNGGELTVDLPADPLMVMADRDHVKRIVLNLLQNARQAGENVHLGAMWTRGEVRITVRDDGPGIPAELQERIFDPFVTDKQQGAGLGLTIVQRLVESNGGRISLAPEEDASLGEGAEFHVYLMSADEFSVQPEPEAPMSGMLG